MHVSSSGLLLRRHMVGVVIVHCFSAKVHKVVCITEEMLPYPQAVQKKTSVEEGRIEWWARAPLTLYPTTLLFQTSSSFFNFELRRQTSGQRQVPPANQLPEVTVPVILMGRPALRHSSLF